MHIETLWSSDLIDTLWNVKNAAIQERVYERVDLIDTLWNVKRMHSGMESEVWTDLIDTLWNVKAVVVVGAGVARRFNRYIVECKGWKMQKHCWTRADLIDTLWNVKLVFDIGFTLRFSI